MSDIFPKWTNRLPVLIIIGVLLMGTAVTAGVWYYFTNKYTNVGYMPLQPVAFSHAIHADQLGVDCRYCHNAVEKSWYSNIPATSVCMNCHNQVLKDDDRLAKVRESYATGQPIPWVQIHKLPDYVYFNHQSHVTAGVSCVTCHGRIDQMIEVHQEKPLNMAWCLDCHRDPAPNVRPFEFVTKLDWQPDPAQGKTARQIGEEIVAEKHLTPPTNCSGCHR